jgi:F-box and leucine-rich repeat protein GRR1
MTTLRQNSPPPNSETSSTGSPDATIYDDSDFFLVQANDSQSSIGALATGENPHSYEEKMKDVAPINRLPIEILIAIISKLNNTSDFRNCMLVSKLWAASSVELLWHRPVCNVWAKLSKVVKSIQKQDGYFAYHELVRRLNLASVSDSISDGTICAFSSCTRIERLTLTGCNKVSDVGLTTLLQRNHSLMALDLTALELVSDMSIRLVSENCKRLQGLNVSGCKQVTDASLIPVSENCKSIKRVSWSINDNVSFGHLLTVTS